MLQMDLVFEKLAEDFKPIVIQVNLGYRNAWRGAGTADANLHMVYLGGPGSQPAKVDSLTLY